MPLSKQHIDLIHHRLFNQQIIPSPKSAELVSAEAVVSWLGAVQSQEYGMAKWSLHLRSPTLREAAIEKAFTDGAILRTHVLRPTWHFVTPQDIRWMLALTAPRVHAFNAPYYKKMELDSRTLKRSKDILVKHLQGNNFLTRTTLQAILTRNKIPAQGLRLALLVMHAELEGIICSGPRQGRQFSYALLAERAPKAKLLDSEEALFRLAHRYFTSRSPATFQDFAWWSGLTVKDAKTAAAMLPANFIYENGYVVNTDTPALPLTKQMRARATFLMPNYDEYGISYKDRSALFVLQKDPALFRRGYNQAFTSALVVDGVVAGRWKAVIKSKAIDVQTSLFTSVSKLQQQLVQNAIKRYKLFHNQ